ncbi:hypothetical protein [Brevibacterium litoralis]|uniref:hypothetical protein n=1 Tax=Brevibacterium litoralis TaxID=3138935 RepID=UPI0032EB4C43
MTAVIGGSADAVAQAKAAGGTVQAFDEDVQSAIGEHSTSLIEAGVENGVLPADITTQIADGVAYWQEEFAGVGYTDQGDLSDFDEWYETDTDYMPYAEMQYLRSGINHRPE